LQEGLYKVELHTVHIHRKLPRKGSDIHVKISTQRHNPDPGFKPLFGTDMITLTLKGAQNGDMVDFEGTALQAPGVAFKAVLTRIGD
jgi:hypothetical protein